MLIEVLPLKYIKQSMNMVVDCNILLILDDTDCNMRSILCLIKSILIFGMVMGLLILSLLCLLRLLLFDLVDRGCKDLVRD